MYEYSQSLLDRHGKELINMIDRLPLTPELKTLLNIKVREVIADVAIDAVAESKRICLEAMRETQDDGKS